MHRATATLIANYMLKRSWSASLSPGSSQAAMAESLGSTPAATREAGRRRIIAWPLL